MMNWLHKNTPKLEWQRLKSSRKNVPDAYRCAIEGGWLLRHGEQTLFIADPHHEWDGNSYDFS